MQGFCSFLLDYRIFALLMYLLGSLVCPILTWVSQQSEKQEVLMQPGENDPSPTTGHHRKHRPRFCPFWNPLTIIPCYVGPIFSTVILLSAWFAHCIGFLRPSPWPDIPYLQFIPVISSRLFRKAPPWLFWKCLSELVYIVEWFTSYMTMRSNS
jgi:hypothetical protein